jgi:hypothetical protein
MYLAFPYSKASMGASKTKKKKKNTKKKNYGFNLKRS